MSNEKLAIFDLDGTLSISYHYTIPAQKKALAEFGVTEISDEVLHGCLGERPIVYAASFLPDCTHEEHLQYLERELYWEKIFMQTEARCFDGVRETLVRLKENGYQTAICSNSAVDYIVPVITALGIDRLIDYIQPLVPNKTKSDTLQILLQKYQPKSALMIGDRIFDKVAAEDNHIPFIGCLFGFNPEEVADADLTVNSAFELYDGIQALIG